MTLRQTHLAVLVMGGLIGGLSLVFTAHTHGSSTPEDRYFAIDISFQKCMGTSTEYLEKAFNGDLKASVMMKGMHDTIITDEFDRLVKIIAQQNGCLAVLRNEFSDVLLKEWYFQKRLENSATVAFLNQMFVDESGRLTTDEAPFLEGTRRHFEEGLNKASVYLRLCHNAYIRDVRLRFPKARTLQLSTQLHLCNSRNAFHQFFCQNDCPSTGQPTFQGTKPTILTSSRSIKAAIRGTLFQKLLFSDLIEEESTGGIQAQNSDGKKEQVATKRSVKQSEGDDYVKLLDEQKKQIQNNIQAASATYKLLLDLVNKRDVRNICKNLTLSKDGDYYVCSEWNTLDKNLQIAIQDTYDERDTRYLYNNLILFLLAHEQGHIVLHKNLLCGNSTITRALKKRIELEADKYASYLLDTIYRDFQSVHVLFQPITFVAADYMFEIAYPFEIFEYDSTYPTLSERITVIHQASMDEETDTFDPEVKKKINKNFTMAERRLYERAIAETYFEAVGTLFQENLIEPRQTYPMYRHRVDIFNFHPVPFILRGPATTIQH